MADVVPSGWVENGVCHSLETNPSVEIMCMHAQCTLKSISMKWHQMTCTVKCLKGGILWRESFVYGGGLSSRFCMGLEKGKTYDRMVCEYSSTV